MCVVNSLHILIVATCIAMLGLSSSWLEFFIRFVHKHGGLGDDASSGDVLERNPCSSSGGRWR